MAQGEPPRCSTARWNDKGAVMQTVIAGAGGFTGGARAARLHEDGYALRCVDRKPLGQWHQVVPEAENVVADLQDLEACRSAVAGADQVYDFAADMGGMGFIEN